MPALFTYGTLRNSQLQIEWFGRELQGVADRIRGYRFEMVEIRDQKLLEESGEIYHPILEEDPEGHGVPGIVLDLSAEEFEKVSTLGFDHYHAIEAVLESGRKAVVYVMNPKKAVKTI